MRLLLILNLFLCGCASGIFDDLTDDAQEMIPKSHDVNVLPESEPQTKSWLYLKEEECKPDKFAADAIPSGYRLNPDCPPDIYYPPRWIPPWDPSPVIVESRELNVR